MYLIYMSNNNPLVLHDNGKLLVLGSCDKNVVIVTVPCSGNVQGSCP